MATYRFWLQSSLSVVLALASVQAAAAQFNWSNTSPVSPTLRYSAGANVVVCKVYSLSELGDDPKLCKWIAETIPEMIQPASWKQGDAKISFYAPSKILVISHSPAVHAQVDEFLQNVKKSVVQARPKATPGLLPAQFAVPDSVRTAQGVQTGPGGYPVPFAPQTPKHLFHFIIRYEGEGIIDSNVVGFAKAFAEGKTIEMPPTVVPPTVCQVLPPPPAIGPNETMPTPNPAKSNASQMPPADPPPARSSEVAPWPLTIPR